jgi:hypothetical protein
MSTRAFLLAAATACIALSLGAPAYGHPNRPASPRSEAKVALPKPEVAKAIVQALWIRRESALVRRNQRAVGTFATASAKAHDDVYLRALKCCGETEVNPHAVTDVFLQIPKESTRPVFFAQVQTTNAVSNGLVWYIVAVERGRDGYWKFAFVTYAGKDDDTPPMSRVTHSDTYTPAVTADTEARIVRQAMLVAHNYPVTRTDEGLVVRSRGAVMRAKEGIYGLALPSGDVLTCYTWHTIGTITYPGHVLVQKAPKYVWGRLLKPGAYTSITVDKAVAQCVAGEEAKREPYWRMQDAERTVSITGVRE